MSKLAPENKFVDLSDYGRFIAKILAKSLVNTPFSPVHVTLLFFITGLAAIYGMLNGQYLTALVLLILKSIIDAADGELARFLRAEPLHSSGYRFPHCRYNGFAPYTLRSEPEHAPRCD